MEKCSKIALNAFEIDESNHLIEAVNILDCAWNASKWFALVL